MKCNWKLIVCLVGLVIAVVGAVLGWAVFPGVVRNQIIDNVVLREGSDQFERWTVMPQPMHFKVYMFNITNHDDVMNGAKPVLEELGPYVFWQARTREEIRVSSDASNVSSLQYQMYDFDARASAPYTLDDRIFAVAMHANGVLEFIEQHQPDLMAAMPFLMEVLFGFNSLIMETTPRQFLFEGVRFCVNPTNDPIMGLACDLIKSQGLQTIREGPTGDLYFSMFAHKNATHNGEFVMSTGVADVYTTAEILKWNGEPKVDSWKEDGHCNEINGTDSSFYRPFRTPESENLYVFSTDVCRSTELQYESEGSYEGIDGLKFVTSDSMLKEMDDCFCINGIPGAIKQENGCLFYGAMDLSSCVGASVVLTFPHFLDTSEEYSKLVDGLSPSREAHETFVLMEPNTGNPLVGHKRVQFNMFLRPITGLPLTENIIPTLMPVLWVNEGIELNEGMVDLLRTTLVNRLILVDAIHWTLFALGLAMFLVFGIWFFVTRNSSGSNNF